MAKKKKEVNLKSFHINQVANGWTVQAKPVTYQWYSSDDVEDNLYIFTNMTHMIDWIEANA